MAETWICMSIIIMRDNSRCSSWETEMMLDEIRAEEEEEKKACGAVVYSGSCFVFFVLCQIQSGQ